MGISQQIRKTITNATVYITTDKGQRTQPWSSSQTISKFRILIYAMTIRPYPSLPQRRTGYYLPQMRKIESAFISQKLCEQGYIPLYAEDFPFVTSTSDIKDEGSSMSARCATQVRHVIWCTISQKEPEETKGRNSNANSSAKRSCVWIDLPPRYKYQRLSPPNYSVLHETKTNCALRKSESPYKAHLLLL